MPRRRTRDQRAAIAASFSVEEREAARKGRMGPLYTPSAEAREALRDANQARLEAAIHVNACRERCTCTVPQDALERALADLKGTP